MQLTFSNCYFNGYNSNASSLLHLNDSIIITVEACHFGYGKYAIVGIEKFPGGIGFSNVVKITGSDFNDQTIGQIRNPGESWTINNCTFEPLAKANGEARGRGRAVVQDAGVAYGLVFSGNWLGDYYQVGGNSHPVIRVGGYGLALLGNRIQLPGDQTAIEITVSQGVVIAGNRIDGGRVGVSFTGGLTYGVEIGGGNDFQVQTPITGEENIRQGLNADTVGYARLGNNGTPNFLDKLTVGGAGTDSIARSTLDVHGSFGTNSRRITVGTYAVANDDHTLEIDASGGAVLVILPVAATPRRELRFKRVDRSANVVTINGNGHNMDTEGLYYLNGFMKHLTIQSSATGAVWYIYASN
jgi:hypothetical protein